MAISDRVRRLLWAHSGGHCQNPSCHVNFFVLFDDGSMSSLEELAHIISQSDAGPRGEDAQDDTTRDEYENIILLCPTCHSLIDKNPKQFPSITLRMWKAEHVRNVQQHFVVTIYQMRSELSDALQQILRSNRAIFDEYGPWSTQAGLPALDIAREWRRRGLGTILPNNRKISALLKANQRLLRENERSIAQKFSLHQEAFEYNHISGNKTAAAPLFPQELNALFLE